jgi:hypothetical protein
MFFYAWKLLKQTHFNEHEICISKILSFCSHVKTYTTIFFKRRKHIQLWFIHRGKFSVFRTAQCFIF